jgi:hypothetical protein
LARSGIFGSARSGIGKASGLALLALGSAIAIYVVYKNIGGISNLASAGLNALETKIQTVF